ncbi:MAG: ABC transporter substrate-binding protein [Candidatus Eremiobacteraeota bacterium]|nr:ABC transporter substrate-binding protein [Candidatus Eremiobacteraeota bacterium]
MKKKAVLFILIIQFLIGIIVFYGSPVYAAEKVEIKFWHAMTRHRGKVLDELVNRFNKTHTDIKVIPVQIKSRDPRMGNNYHALYKKILENLARKTPPDVSQVYENWVCQLIDIGVIVPIGDSVGKPDGIPQSEINDLVPVFREANSYDGKLWTLPFNKSIYVLYYNKDIFKSVGVQPPKTWGDFKKVAKKLTKRQGQKTTRYGIAFRPSVDLFSHYLYAYGGNFISGNKAVFNSPIGIKNLQFWVDMVHKDRTALASFNDRRDFVSGKSAMYIDTTSRIGTFKRKANFNWGVALLPKGTTRQYAFAGTNLAIFSHLSPEKKKAAVKFVNFMSSKESTIYWALKTGYLPVKKSAINSPQYREQLKKDPRYRVGVEALKYAKVQPKVAAWEMIRGIVDDAMFEAISLRNTPQEALGRAVKLANHLIRNISGMAR